MHAFLLATAVMLPVAVAEDICGAEPSVCVGTFAGESLDLSNQALTGTLPPALGQLSRLVNISLSNNALSGTLPPEVGRGGQVARLILKAYKVVTTTEFSVDDERRLNRRASPRRLGASHRCEDHPDPSGSPSGRTRSRDGPQSSVTELNPLPPPVLELHHDPSRPRTRPTLLLITDPNLILHPRLIVSSDSADLSPQHICDVAPCPS